MLTRCAVRPIVKARVTFRVEPVPLDNFMRLFTTRCTKFSASHRGLLSFATLLPICVVALLTTLSLNAARGAEPANRPNILLMLADNWAYPHASAYGDSVVKTPSFDRLAREGAKFTHAFCLVPSCAPARAVLLTGQTIHRLGPGANNWGTFPNKFPVYPEMLAAHGYETGFAGKGWAPAPLKESKRDQNPAGPQFENFTEFLDSASKDKPFCFWFGSRNPHSRWTANYEATTTMDANDVRVPSYLPDTPEVRKDILNYYAEVQAFDQELGAALKELDSRRLAENTLVIVAGDNGWQMPRGLSNLYDAGTRVPFAIRWQGKLKPGQTIESFVNFDDIAPTILEAAGIKVPDQMTGKSLVPLLTGKPAEPRDVVFLERERHAHVREGNLGYPMRAIRTRDFLYIRNFASDRWPAGNPELVWSVGPYGDVDASAAKTLITATPTPPEMRRFYKLSFAQRPAEELYDLKSDPDQINNVATSSEYAEQKAKLKHRLEDWMARMDDPRSKNPNDDRWDKAPYFGGRAKSAR